MAGRSRPSSLLRAAGPGLRSDPESDSTRPRQDRPGPPFRLPPGRRRRHPFPWIFAIRGGFAADATTDREALLVPALLSRIDTLGYQAARYHEALAEVPRLPGEHGLERRMREVGCLHLTRFVQVPARPQGPRRHGRRPGGPVPFCDHRLVQYVFNAPWAMKRCDGREKSLLRAAARDVLPGSVGAARRPRRPRPPPGRPGRRLGSWSRWAAACPVARVLRAPVWLAVAAGQSTPRYPSASPSRFVRSRDVTGQAPASNCQASMSR